MCFFKNPQDAKILTRCEQLSYYVQMESQNIVPIDRNETKIRKKISFFDQHMDIQRISLAAHQPQQYRAQKSKLQPYHCKRFLNLAVCAYVPRNCICVLWSSITKSLCTKICFIEEVSGTTILIRTLQVINLLLLVSTLKLVILL